MADNCKLTAGAGGGKGLDQALETTIKGKIESEFVFGYYKCTLQK